MSRYVRVTTELREREDIRVGLAALGLDALAEFADPRVPVMLTGSLECAGEPVEIRLPAGTLGTVEDFGFARSDSRGPFALVCGEYDRELLERDLVAPLLQAVATARARRVAEETGAELRETVDADGTRRITLRRR